MSGTVGGAAGASGGAMASGMSGDGGDERYPPTRATGDAPVAPKRRHQQDRSSRGSNNRRQMDASGDAPNPMGDEREAGIDQGQEVVEEELLDLKYGAHNVITIFTPVTVCMAVVVATISSVTFYTRKDGIYLIYTPFHEQSSDPATLAWQALANVAILLGVIAVMTFLLVAAYKFKCYWLINGWLVVSSLMLLFLFSFLYLSEVLKAYNLPMDYITFAIFMWNFGVMGMLCIHWKGPLLLQQMYLIFISALMALIFIKYLPNWTTWAVLAVISLWDLFAVLAPFGPLRILVETAQERNEQIFPSLIYSAGVLYSLITVATTEDGSRDDEEEEQGGFNQDWVEGRDNRRVAEPVRPLRRQERVLEEEEPQEQLLIASEEDKGIKLGLGDFIFYSILVGKASSYGDWNTTIACFVAILIGLCLTLMFLASFRRALPALPISVFFGLIFYFLTREIITPFTDLMSANQVFM